MALHSCRHPYTPKPCRPPSTPGGGIGDRSYILLTGLSSEQFARAYPGRKFMFDLGSGITYQSSLAWFVDAYGAEGIKFDEIWVRRSAGLGFPDLSMDAEGQARRTACYVPVRTCGAGRHCSHMLRRQCLPTTCNAIWPEGWVLWAQGQG